MSERRAPLSDLLAAGRTALDDPPCPHAPSRTGTHPTKNGDPRTIHLNQNADAVLARRWTPDAKGLVFGGKNWNSYRSAWEKALRMARIENFRFHDLRHTFASWAVQRGATLQEVKDLLGHKTLAMTLRYAHLAPERLRAAAASLDGILPSQGASRAQEIHAPRNQHQPIGDPATTSRV